MFDLLLAGEVVGDDCDATIAGLEQSIGLPKQAAEWRYPGGPGRGFRVAWCRVHPSTDVAPTLLEVVGNVLPLADVRRWNRVEHIVEVLDLQQQRAIRTHATVVACSDLDAVVERLRSGRVRHWVDERDYGLAGRRVWLGIDGSSRFRYEPQADAGLFLELIETRALLRPPASFNGQAFHAVEYAPDILTKQPVVPKDLDPSAMVRLLAKEHLVADIDQSLRCLEHSFGWIPAGPVRRSARDGVKVARLEFSVPHSARVDLVQPTEDGPIADFAARNGPGAFRTVIGVVDLDAKHDDLRSRGTAASIIGAKSGENPRLRVAVSETPGAWVEFEQIS